MGKQADEGKSSKGGAAPDKAERPGGRGKKSRPGQPARPLKAAKPPEPARAGNALAGDMAASRAGGAVHTLRKRDLINAVTAAAPRMGGMRGVMDATLAAIGAALDRGEALNLPPLGRMRVTRRGEAGGAATLVIRLRRPAAQDAAAAPVPAGDRDAPDPLAEPDEDR